MKVLLQPFSWGYQEVMRLRSYLYKSGFFKSYKVNIPVVCVGNLTVGGTGKTPIVCRLIERMLDRGLSPGVISRGYRGDFNDVAKVTLNSSVYFGDEPTLIAQKFPSVPVYVGGNRVKVARMMESAEKVDLIIMDDGFQHQRLNRSLNILVVDVSVDVDEYQPLPLGRAREGWSALQRVDILIFNKFNLATKEQKEAIVTRVTLAANKSSSSPVILYGNYVLDGICRGETLYKGVPEKILLVSGIGNPRSFESLVKKFFPQTSIEHLIYKDHHYYTVHDIRHIMNVFSDKKVSILLTTEKDLIKLQKWPELEKLLWTAKLGLELSEGEDVLVDKIHCLVR